ncbi:MAG: sugar ABC transporter permease [Candidatus Caldarchaeum sp.]|jgi:ABC-type sugar transport system permease subunit|uniref:Sugar ABC transporter permease n=1 Tax=Caldiarchaeum subterraneum TaxID=311458 RepID=A0A7J3WCB2_CALS0
MQKGDVKFVLIGLLPALSFIFPFTFYPIAYAVYVSTLRYDLKYPEQIAFAGFDNFIEVLTSYYMADSVQATIIFVVIAVPIVVLLSLGLAMLLNQNFRGVGFLQWLVLVPWAIPLVDSGAIWKWIFDANYGIFNAALKSLGLIDSYVPWLNLRWPAMLVLVIAFLWVQLPLPTLLFLAGMQSIPQELYEAAVIDGAGAWAKFRTITLTWLRPFMLIVAVYTSLMAIWTFDLVYVITAGGPGNFTAVISYYTWSEMFTFLNFGRASALSFLVVLVSIGLIIAYFRALRIGRLRLRA